MSLADRLTVKEFGAPEDVSSPDSASALFAAFLGDFDREAFMVLCMDAKNHPLALAAVHIGDLTSSIVSQRTIARFAIEWNAATVILCHNHPSGDSSPSSEDVLVTEQTKKALALFDIYVADHIILAGGAFGSAPYYSFRRSGLLT